MRKSCYALPPCLQTDVKALFQTLALEPLHKTCMNPFLLLPTIHPKPFFPSPQRAAAPHALTPSCCSHLLGCGPNTSAVSSRVPTGVSTSVHTRVATRVATRVPSWVSTRVPSYKVSTRVSRRTPAFGGTLCGTCRALPPSFGPDGCSRARWLTVIRNPAARIGLLGGTGYLRGGTPNDPPLPCGRPRWVALCCGVTLGILCGDPRLAGLQPRGRDPFDVLPGAVLCCAIPPGGLLGTALPRDPFLERWSRRYSTQIRDVKVGRSRPLLLQPSPSAQVQPPAWQMHTSLLFFFPLCPVSQTQNRLDQAARV